MACAHYLIIFLTQYTFHTDIGLRYSSVAILNLTRGTAQYTILTNQSTVGSEPQAKVSRYSKGST